MIFLELTCKIFEQFYLTPRRDSHWLINCFLFSNTFSAVQEKSDQIWKFERYKLVIEYHNRPSLVPPFILLSHIWLLLKYIHRKYTNKENKSAQNLRKLLQFFIIQLHGHLFNYTLITRNSILFWNQWTDEFLNLSSKAPYSKKRKKKKWASKKHQPFWDFK